MTLLNAVLVEVIANVRSNAVEYVLNNYYTVGHKLMVMIDHI